MDKKNGHPIKAYARMRPFSKTDPKPKIIDHTISPKEFILKSGFTEKKYNFDQVFNSESSQLDVYNAVVSPMIPQIIAGYNWTVIGYGQTGTGKTHTIFGENKPILGNKCKEDPTVGLILLSAEHLFCELSKLDLKTEFTVQVSFFEVINEEVHDLLSDYASLRIYDDPLNKGSLGIKDLSKLTVLNTKYVNDWLNIGLNERKKAHSKLNYDSSRGHLFFRILVNVRKVNSRGEESIKSGRLQFVDTANSEFGNRPTGRDSTAHRSSITLARVIKALNQKLQFVPFRDSKLTRILQDSFGGNTKTAIIATFSINSCHWDETINTLDCAVAAKTIINHPQINSHKKQADILMEIENEISKLGSELAAARKGVGFYVSIEKYEQMTEDMETTKNKVLESLRQIENLEELVSVKKQQCSALTQSFKDTKVYLEEKKSELQKKLLTSKETEALLNNVSQKYNKMIEKNNILKEVCDTSTKNVDVFHGKYQNKSQTFVENANAARDVANTVKATFKDTTTTNECCLQQVMKNLDEIKTHHHSINHEYLPNLKEIITNLSKEISEIGKNNILDFHGCGKNETESVVSNMYQNVSEKLDQLDEINKVATELKNRLTGKGNLWQKHGEELVLQWNEAVNHIESNDKKIRENIHKLRQDLAKRKENCLNGIHTEEENLRVFQKMYDLNCQEEEELKEELRSIENAIELTYDVKNHSDGISQLEEQYQPDFIKHVQNANEMLEEVNSEVKQIRSTSEETRNNVTDVYKKGQEDISNLVSDLYENLNKIIEKHVEDVNNVANDLQKPISDLQIQQNLGLEACRSANENLENILELKTQRYFNVTSLISRTRDIVSTVHKNINSVGHAGDTPARRRYHLNGFFTKKFNKKNHNDSDKEN